MNVSPLVSWNGPGGRLSTFVIRVSGVFDVEAGAAGHQNSRNSRQAEPFSDCLARLRLSSWNVGVGRSADERCGKHVPGKAGLGRIQQERIGLPRRTAAFCSALENSGRCSIRFDDSFGKQIPHRFTFLRHIGCEDVIEAAVFTDDYDHVLDW